MANPTAFKGCALFLQDNHNIVVGLIGSDNYVYVGTGQINNPTQANTWSSLANTATGASAISVNKASDGKGVFQIVSNSNAYVRHISQATINGAWTASTSNTNLGFSAAASPSTIASCQLDNQSGIVGIISNTGGNTTQGNFAVSVQNQQSGFSSTTTVIYGT